MGIKLYRNENGLTFIEILLALSFAIIVISGVIQVYMLIHNFYEKQILKSEVQYSVRMALHKIGDDIRTCQKTMISPAGDILTIEKDSEIIRYYTQNNTLYRQQKTSVPIAENITLLNFSSESNLIVIILGVSCGNESRSIIGYYSNRVN